MTHFPPAQVAVEVSPRTAPVYHAAAGTAAEHSIVGDAAS